MAEDFSVVKNSPKPDGSDKSFSSDEWFRSEESLSSKDLYNSKVAHGANGLSAKPVEEYTVIAKPVDGDPHRSYRRYDWQGVFQMGDIKVCQLGRKKKKFDKIYGKIKLQHSNGEWNLYNRKKEDAETIDVPGFITVTPPPYGISPYDLLKISFDMEGGLKGMNEKVVYWSAGWDFCNRVYYYRIRRRGCSIKLSYMGFSGAVLADMKIELLHMCHQEQIYGTITASFSKVPRLPPLFMFNKKRVGCVCVKEKEPVPLSRPFIAYPHGNELKINVDLQTISGTPVAQGAIKIIPQTLGRWVGVLEKRGEIQVRATVLFFPFDDRN